jgi:hypothetical protein
MQLEMKPTCFFASSSEMQLTVGPVGPRGQNFRGSNKWRLCVGPNDRQTFLLLGLSFQFRLKDHPGRLSFSYADILAFLFSVDKSIGSGCFFQDLDPSVNLIGHAAITEMIKLQFTTITDRIQNKIREGNWFPKFSINRKEQKFLSALSDLGGRILEGPANDVFV